MPHVSRLELPRPRDLRVVARPSRSGVESAPCFFAGPENALALRATQRLLKASPGDPLVRQWSPVALVGPPGCGKSRLAAGVADAWRERLSADEEKEGDDSVLVLTAGDFRRRLDEAIRAQTVAAFRERLAALSLLVIEDLHRLAGSAHVLEEFEATLDALHARGALVLATLLRPPSDCRDFSRQLISRFAAGLTVEVAPLAPEARAGLLTEALAGAGRRIEPGAAARIGESLSGDARRVLHTAAALGERFGPRTTIGDEQARAFLAERAPDPSPPLREIAAAAGRYYKLTLRELRSVSRKQHVVLARAVAIYLARQLTPLSYDEIGRFFGGRDHTTIMHNHQRIERALGVDRALQAAVAEVGAAVTR